jgi:hypothetical protein
MHAKRLALAITFVALSICGGASAASAAHRSPISIRIVLGTTLAKAGTPIHGTAILTNTNRTRLVVEACAYNGWLFVGLTNQSVTFDPAVTTVGCAPSVTLKPGANRFRITVATTYQECEVHGTPRCTKNGAPALPKGTYHTDVVTLGLPKGTPTLTHLRVTLQ